MVGSVDQLKARIRNLSKGDSAKAQILMRHFGAERFLERLSISPYHDNFILKGGTLVAAKVGLEQRSTFDIDTTLKNVPLSEASVLSMVQEISEISLPDGILFQIRSAKAIMHESDYPGIRVLMEAILGKVRIPMKIDFSTDDVITPHEVVFSLPLMFEDRTISLLAYNTETTLAEKLETVISRGIANTRMRDFYDIHSLGIVEGNSLDYQVLKEAFANTSKKRNTDISKNAIGLVIKEIKNSQDLFQLWNKYRQEFDYAEDIEWETVVTDTESMLKKAAG